MYATLQNAVWSELKSGQEIDPLRRNLQREHLKRLQALLTRGAPGVPADAVSVPEPSSDELPQPATRRPARRKKRGSALRTSGSYPA